MDLAKDFDPGPSRVIFLLLILSQPSLSQKFFYQKAYFLLIFMSLWFKKSRWAGSKITWVRAGSALIYCWSEVCSGQVTAHLYCAV